MTATDIRVALEYIEAAERRHRGDSRFNRFVYDEPAAAFGPRHDPDPVFDALDHELLDAEARLMVVTSLDCDRRLLDVAAEVEVGYSRSGLGWQTSESTRERWRGYPVSKHALYTALLYVMAPDEIEPWLIEHGPVHMQSHLLVDALELGFWPKDKVREEPRSRIDPTAVAFLLSSSKPEVRQRAMLALPRVARVG